MIDILALWGDSSDNIPGAPGIGEKTSKKLIAKYKSLENLLEHTDELSGKIKESIVQNVDRIRLSRDLATIRLDVPVELHEKELAYGGANIPELVALFRELEFKNLAEKVLSSINATGSGSENVPGNDVPGETKEGQGSLFSENVHGASVAHLKKLEDVEHRYQAAETPEKVQSLAEKLKNLGEFCFDTETTSINALDAELVGMAFSWEAHKAWYVPFPADRKKASRMLDHFRPVFIDQGILKVGQNLKYDIQVLRNYGIRVGGPVFDTMIAHYLIRPEQRHSLDYLAEAYLGYRNIPTEELIGKKTEKQSSMRDVTLERIKDYACEDADITWQLYRILDEELKKTGLKSLALDVEFPLVSVLCVMEESGIRIDRDFLDKYAGVLSSELLEMRDAIYELAGEEFNISSPKQLGEILFEKLKISSDAKKTKSKQYSTSEDVLIRLADKHPVVNKVLEFRTLKKLLSTYVEALPKMINPRTGLIHTSFNQAVAATGRLSSNNPNLQNIPIREERGREIRKAFIPRSPEYILLSADYSQIELRLMAHMSGDPVMKEAFQKGEDIHTSTASKIFNVSPSEVSREQRGKAKTANFGIIYGISSFGLAQRMNLTRKEAKQLIDNYFNTYKRIREYMDECIAAARQNGYVETMMGRRRYLRDINSRNAVVRGFAERNAINAPIQGSAADIIKVAMIRIQADMERREMNSKMILQVHDELVFDVYRTELEDLREMVISEMESAWELSIPLVADYGTGSNWLEAHE